MIHRSLHSVSLTPRPQNFPCGRLACPRYCLVEEIFDGQGDVRAAAMSPPPCRTVGDGSPGHLRNPLMVAVQRPVQLQSLGRKYPLEQEPDYQCSPKQGRLSSLARCVPLGSHIWRDPPAVPHCLCVSHACRCGCPGHDRAGHGRPTRANREHSSHRAHSKIREPTVRQASGWYRSIPQLNIRAIVLGASP